MWVPPGNMSQIIQIIQTIQNIQVRDLSALPGRSRSSTVVGIDHTDHTDNLSKVCTCSSCYHASNQPPSTLALLPRQSGWGQLTAYSSEWLTRPAYERKTINPNPTQSDTISQRFAASPFVLYTACDNHSIEEVVHSYSKWFLSHTNSTCFIVTKTLGAVLKTKPHPYLFFITAKCVQFYQSDF